MNLCSDNSRVSNPSLYRSRVFPSADYSPWMADDIFLKVYDVIKLFTLVDIYRCFELWHLVEQSAKLDAGAILEVGVWRGGTAALIGTKAKLSNIIEPIFLCDTFEGVVKASNKDSVYKGGEHCDTDIETVQWLLNHLYLTNAKILKGVFPDETSSVIDRFKFRFCHIDVDVYESAKDIAEWVWDRLIVGGMIVYDDYGYSTCDGVTKYVEEQIYLRDRLIIHNLNGHAVVIKLH